MPSPYNLALVEHCSDCSQRQTPGAFCNMAAEPVAALDSMKFTGAYPKGALLFVEGEQPRGVFVLCRGQAKLTTTSSDGRTLIVKIANPGEILGVSAAILGRPYEVSAETLAASQVSFVRRDDFLRFLNAYSEACMHTAQQLSEKYEGAQREIRSLGLAHTTSEKLARLLLGWSKDGESTAEGTRMQVLLTHEEIGQMIGTTRETVTRLLSDFKRKKLISVKGSSLFILAAQRMQDMVFS
ncbi:MAG: family transcriptional regulator, cyclic receptor protein [Acidobacteriota bacterium]|jgi:CRP/FNR family transcriptional regulator|nr:family transcriptional regulator, cyclic receptor protein [Acidobacteriota bacterium]